MRILLAGTNRCGSTWVANVLARTRGMVTVFEPDAPETDILGTVTTRRIGRYPVLDPDQDNFWYSMLWDLAFKGGWPWARVPSARRAGRGLARTPAGFRDLTVAALARTVAVARARPEHVAVKSVNSSFALEWIARRYRPRTVILHRDPLNVVSSWFVLNLQGDETLSDTGRLSRRRLAALGVPPPPGSPDRVASLAWQVGALMSVQRATAARHPDWVVVSYDALSEAPQAGFAALFDRLGLAWTDAAQQYLLAADDPKFAVTGASREGRHPNERTQHEAQQSRRLEQRSGYERRLTPQQIDEARAVLADMPLGDWA